MDCVSGVEGIDLDSGGIESVVGWVTGGRLDVERGIGSKE
jgi:hypothetical protein